MSETIKVEPNVVTWAEFGEKIDSFIAIHGQKLNDIDLIIGFTRGGMILATILSTLLRDIYQENAKEHPALWSLRPIPSGITTKNYRLPCFVMDSPMSEEEAADCKKLLKDIKRFKAGREKLKILLVDDNLTGATRLFAYRDFIRRKVKSVEIKTLAYSRLESFSHPQLDYLVDAPHPANKYVIMPYHKDHGIFKLPSLEISPIVLVLSNPSNFELLNGKLRRVIGPFSRMKRSKGRFITMGRGASIIDVAMGNKQLKLTFLYGKYYPPKRCLETAGTRNIGTFEELSLWSLCNLGARKADTVCFYCSSLNCNYDVLKTVLLNSDPSSNFDVHQTPSASEETILVRAVKSWLLHFRDSMNRGDMRADKAGCSVK